METLSSIYAGHGTPAPWSNCRVGERVGGGGGGGQRESSCLAVIILSRVEGVFALQHFPLQQVGTLCTGVGRRPRGVGVGVGGEGGGCTDSHTIPFDKLRPVGNKVAEVGTQQPSKSG